MLNVSQPTLTRYVQRLEKQVGARLFDRTGRGVTLTEAGESLLKHGKTIVARVHRAHAEINEIGNNPGGSVVLGLAPIAGKVLSVPVSKRFLAEVPKAQLRIVECFTGYVREWVATGRIDVGILYQDGVMAPLEGDRLWDEEFVLVCPRAGHLEGQIEVRFADIVKLPLILPSRPHGLRVKIDETAARQQAPLNIAVETDGLNVILDLVRNGVGYAILTPPALYGLEATADLVGIPIVEPRISSTVISVCSRQVPLTDAIRSLMRIVIEEAQAVRTGRGCAQGFRPPMQLSAADADKTTLPTAV